ncbi:MAG: T9SS type A sorting domain-containing protein [Flavobacteriales bacterium]|nr:T9SS type A sorting domain-containing protein [Flavobacteriales bacterium]
MASSIRYHSANWISLYTPEGIHYALNGLNVDGNPLLDPGGQQTTFQFPGDPNVSSEWSEMNVAPTPFTTSRRTVSAIGPFTLAPGDTLCVDLAFVFAQDSVGGNLGSVALLKERVAQVRAWYQQQNVQCNGSYGLVTGITDATPSTLALHIFPNPANDRISIRLGALNEPATVRLLDAQGRLVRSERAAFSGGNAEVDLTGTTSGLYTVQIETTTARHHAHLLVAH